METAKSLCFYQIAKRKMKPISKKYLKLIVCDTCNEVFNATHGLQKNCTKCVSAKNEKYKRICAKKYWDRLRKKIYLHYGNKCKTCGIEDRDVFTIDHVLNNGKEERKIFKCTQAVFMKIVREGYPDSYQLLCRNCNWKKNIINRRVTLNV